jgi:putative DNA methylase
MSSRERYPNRLIEVDLPIKRISAHARRENSVRHGNISTMHTWWARRPLAACRAVICAALWPDPADSQCPESFIQIVREHMLAWTPHDRQKLLGEQSRKRFEKARKNPEVFDDVGELRGALLDFIADFANWDNSSVREYLETSHKLTHAAHEALGGAPGTRPLVVDPFAGGGSIPIEALRAGADVFASDLNPIPVLLNKVLLEYIPKYSDYLVEEVQKWGRWISHEAEKELAEYYPKDDDGATPIAYLWARTIQCEGPGCGAVIPLMNQRIISRRRGVGVEFSASERTVEVNVVTGVSLKNFEIGTVRNGKVTCPVCGFTMHADRYRQRAKQHELGEMQYCTILSHPDGSRKYRSATSRDREIFRKAQTVLKNVVAQTSPGAIEAIPNERLSDTEPRRLNIRYYGFDEWGQLFNDRQKLCWVTFSHLLSKMFSKIELERGDKGLARAVSTIFGLILRRYSPREKDTSTEFSSRTRAARFPTLHVLHSSSSRQSMLLPTKQRALLSTQRRRNMGRRRAPSRAGSFGPFLKERILYVMTLGKYSLGKISPMKKLSSGSTTVRSDSSPKVSRRRSGT